MQPDLAASAAEARQSRFLHRLTDEDTRRAVIYIGFAVLLVVAWMRNINWDEFFFLSHIHAHLQGNLDRAMQTAYVHAFGWLAWIPGKEMGQIFVARLLMTALLGVTCYSIFRIAKEMSGRMAADIAVIAFLTSGFVIVYGASFRSDPIAAAALMSAMAILLTSRMGTVQIIATAVLMAAALLVTVKAVLYFPALIGVLIWRWEERGTVLRILAAAVIGVALAGVLYLWHASGIASAPGNETSDLGKRALHSTLLKSGLFPRGQEALLWALLSAGAIALACVGLISAGSRRKTIAIVAFCLPLVLSIALYRNAFPYFFPFIAPPLMIVAAIGAAHLGRGPVLGAMMALMICTGAGQSLKAVQVGSAMQEATLTEVHRLFPEPVPYIDHNAMVATFPRHLFFMSSMGMQHYRAKAQPVMANLIETHQPPLLIANRWALHVAMHDPDHKDGPYMLFPEDRDTLRQSYVHYAGTIWLAGRDVTLDAGSTDITLPFPGRYRVETESPVLVDGQSITDGAVLNTTGTLKFSGREGQTLRLIWDTAGAPNSDALPMGAVYAPFWQLPF